MKRVRERSILLSLDVKKEHNPMTRVRIALISKPEMNFTETADLLEACLNDSAFNATCTRVPDEWVVFVTLPPHLLEGLLEWCRISTFAARYIDSNRVVPESTSIRVRLTSDVTPEQVEDTLSSIRRFLVKYWLISLNRIDDLHIYDETHDSRFEREAEQAGFSVEIVEEKNT
jgi:hypothetical protein